MLYVVDIHGDIEGDYDIITKVEDNDIIKMLCRVLMKIVDEECCDYGEHEAVEFAEKYLQEEHN